MADADPIRPTTGPLRTFELIRDRAVEAVLGQSRLSHPGLAAEIRRQFGSTDVAAGALVREPVIEGAAPFVTDGRTFADCAGRPLHPRVIDAIASDRAGVYRFPPDAQPYRHQLEAWEHLSAADRRSVLVSSGTGSGKTECFLMPVLSDLAAEAETSGRLSGVRAIALYPLNALIASQQERLSAWTAPFGGDIRFGLYNGLTPERLARSEIAPPEQAMDRLTLRSDPPPILVTNVTMLEYMIVRQIDRPLIEASRGKLRWIILDEAHSYIGSAAAEIALLIRRVLLTFGVRAEEVRFVATSATIGDGTDVTDELRRFLRDLSGADDDRVRVVLGERETVTLPPPAGVTVGGVLDLADRAALTRHPAVQAFVRSAEAGPVTLEQSATLLRPAGHPVEQIIEAIVASDAQRDPLLPLRIHGFMRAVPGLWSCIHPDCSGAPVDWPYGRVLAHGIDACPSCASPVLEIKTCRECGEPCLTGEDAGGQVRAVTTAPTIDEFAATLDREHAEDEDGDSLDAESDYDAAKVAIALRPLPGNRQAHINPATGRRTDQAEEETRPYPVRSPDLCGHCGAQDANGPIMRPLRFGAPFLIGNAAPVLLEGVPPRASASGVAYPPPAEGRQLLSFTDSRQGTARFAANLQTNAERSYVRGYIYHAVQGSMAGGGGDDGKADALRAEIATLEPHAIAVPTIAALLETKRAGLAALARPSLDGVAWTELRTGLAARPEVKEWMQRIWKDRDERYRDPSALAEFLLLRELARRPRRANTVETMGLAWLRFAAIERSKQVPEALLTRGFGLSDWHGLLHSIVNLVARGRFAIHAAWSDMHWLHSRTPLTELLEPGREPQASREIRWPMVGKSAGRSNLALILSKQLGLDPADSRGRTQLNAVLEGAWNALLPLFSDPTRPGLALDFAKAHVAPVVEAWQCPVTGRVLPTTVLGLTPYGHREHLRTAALPPRPITFPALPVTFPRAESVETVRAWLDGDPQIAVLRGAGIWSSLHDRAALLAPYLRAAEHSAQQPPDRLRRFEGDFKRGEINVLNCSTTMEMGVDIGSVSAVMMTNVPPALANYRQRVGRAGRRRQGFAASLTYTRDSALDREAFRDPVLYLGRSTRAPRIKLDSRRIVQRHVNALLLARWFAGAGGEAMKTEVGAFFGLPAAIGAVPIDNAPVVVCRAWLMAPSTAEALGTEVDALTAGTVLAGDRTLFAAAETMVGAAFDGVKVEWEAIQGQAQGLTREAQLSLGFQLRRLVNDNLLKELGYRGVLPSHGFPTGVVPFVNDDRPPADAPVDDNSRRRRSFPTRTLDIAIRDYAPGAEVVVDGLVYRSAGVTLNWLRPVDDTKAVEEQNLRYFWSCAACGAGDVAAVVPPKCLECSVDLDERRRLRFLSPAGFTADAAEKPHADTDEITYVEPEPEQIIARGALWSSMADPAAGRLRASPDGLVFYSSRGPGKNGYVLCLECGRAAPAGSDGDTHPLKDHKPLRYTRKGTDGRCPGNDKGFKITPPIALGHEATTDVVELQPIGLEIAGAAWAAVSALRSALCRQLGIETSELGIAIRRVRAPLGQITHSLFLFDRASGGAGFAQQAVPLYDSLLADAATRLDCPEGCARGCSACVLAPDMYRQAEVIERRPALEWARAAYAALRQVPDEDRAGPDAALVRSVADSLIEEVDRGARSITIWAGSASDPAAFGTARFALLMQRLRDRGVKVATVVEPAWLDGLDVAQRLALRDAALKLGLSLKRGTAPVYPNGASAIAQAGSRSWVSRDAEASAIGAGWGEGQAAPIVSIAADPAPLSAAIDLASLLPASGTRHFEVEAQLDGFLADFGRRFAVMLLPAIREAGGTGRLVRIAYTDRYLSAPLTVRLLTEALAGLRDELASGSAVIPVHITTRPLKIEDRSRYRPHHDWRQEEDRAAVLHGLLENAGFRDNLEVGEADHGRTISLTFDDDRMVRVILDQGFGPWRAPAFAKWDHFGDDKVTQTRKISQFNAMLSAQGPSYAVVTRS